MGRTYVSYYVFPYVSLLYRERASCINTEVTAHVTILLLGSYATGNDSGFL